MTREEQKAYNAENYPASVLTWLNEATDRAFDDFESRTCENCEHWFMAITRDKDNNNTKTPTCMLSAMSDDTYTIFPHKDFGCNKWEKKQ